MLGMVLILAGNFLMFYKPKGINLGGGVATFLLNRIKPLNVSVCKKWVGVVAAANLLRYRGVGCDKPIFDGISSR